MDHCVRLITVGLRPLRAYSWRRLFFRHVSQSLFHCAWGGSRSHDLLLFRQALLPTELPKRAYPEAEAEGLEPPGRGVKRLSRFRGGLLIQPDRSRLYISPFCGRPVGELNPCFHRDGVMSLPLDQRAGWNAECGILNAECCGYGRYSAFRIGSTGRQIRTADHSCPGRVR